MQYFEMLTNRAIYQDGWVAVSRFGVPWQTAGRVGDFSNASWELLARRRPEFALRSQPAASSPPRHP